VTDPLIQVQDGQVRDLQGRFLAGVSQTIMRREMDNLSLKLKNALMYEAPRDTGALRNSFQVKSLDLGGESFGFQISSSVPYAKVQATGSQRKNYLIRPRGPWMLGMRKREYVGGAMPSPAGRRIVYRPYARHPGIKANPYHRRAIKDIQPDIVLAMRAMGRSVMSQLVSRRVSL